MATIRTNSGLIDSTASFALSTANNQVTLGDIKTCVTNLSTNALLIGDDLTVAGNFIVHGDTTTLNTNVTATSAFRVDNDGTGPALVANQTGSQPVVDFQDDGVSVFYIEDGGNVGIGTTDPVSKLQVVDSHFDLTAANKNGISITDDAFGIGLFTPALGFGYNGNFEAGLAGVYGSADNNQLGLMFFTHPSATSSADAVEAMRITYDGDVGIGTTDPSAKLHIADSGNDVKLTIDRTDARTYSIYTDSNSKLHIKDEDAGADRISILSGGNVGIGGTPNSSYKLDIAGDTLIQDSESGDLKLLVDNTSTSTLARTVIELKNNSGSSAGLALPSTNYTGIAQWANRLIVNTDSGIANGILVRPATGGFTVSTTGLANSNLRVDTSGNVGIGTTNPSHPLTVHANTGAANTPVAWIHNSGNVSEYDGTVISTVNDGSDAEVLHVRTNTTTYNGGTSLMLVRGDGNVGIGQVAPSDLLHIGDSATDPAISLDYANTGSGLIKFRDAGTVSAQIVYNDTVNQFQFDAGGAGLTKMVVGSNGNVGIGTTTPNYKFEITGDVGSGLISRIYNTNADGQGLLIRAGSTASATRVLQLASENDTKIMTVNSNGKVGIGTTTPLSKLDVRGTVSIENGQYLRWNNSADTERSSIKGDTSDNLIFYTGSSTTEAMRIDTSQNVGIGTTPSEQLHITGNFRMPATTATTGIIYRDGNRFIHTFQHPTGSTAIPLGLNLFIGNQAGNLTAGATATSTSHASFNIGIGQEVMEDLTTGFSNTVIGTYAGRELTTAAYNAFFGSSAGQFNTTGSRNAFFGYLAGRCITDGGNNTGLGGQTLTNITTGNSNLAAGTYAVDAITGSLGIVGLGYSALSNLTSGNYSIAIGYAAGSTNSVGGSLLDSDYGIFIGYGVSPVEGSIKETLIGYDVDGNGSNTMTLGGVGQTDVYLTGQVHVSILNASASDSVVTENAGVLEKRTINSGAWGTQTADRVIISNGSGTITTDSVLQWNGSNFSIGSSLGVGDRLRLIGVDVAVDVNATNYHKGIYSASTNFYNIAPGVTDSGYRIAVDASAFVSDADFEGTLSKQYAVWARHGANVSTAGSVITNSYGVYIDSLTTANTTITNLWGLYQEETTAKNYFAGNVGIGVTPITRFHVKGASNSNVMVVDATGTAPNYIFDVRDDGVSKFRVDGAGNVGIGTTTAVAGVDVQRTSGGTGASGTDGLGGVRVRFSSGYGASLDAWDGGSPRWGVISWSAHTPTVVMEGSYSTTQLRINHSILAASLASSSSNSVITENAGVLEKRTIASTAWAASFTEGSVPFADSSGDLTEDNTNFFWNDTDKTLKAGKAIIGTWELGATYAVFANSGLDLSDAGNYGVLHQSTGRLLLNAPTGQSLRFRINNADIATLTSTGLGIGTTTPANILSVAYGDASTSITNGKSQLELTNSNATDGNYSRIVFDDVVGGAGAVIIGAKIIDHTNNYGDFQIWTRGAGGNGTRLHVDSAGNVGIGTTTPLTPLHVTSTGIGSNFISVQDTRSTTGDLAGIRFSTSANTTVNFKSFVAHIETGSNGLGDLVFAVDSNGDAADAVIADEKMRINSAGNVGIGMTTPVGKLDVLSTGWNHIRMVDTLSDATNKAGHFTMAHYTNAQESFGLISGRSTSTTNVLNLGGSSAGLNAATEIAFWTAATNTTTTGTQRMTIDSTGNVGIGTDVPDGNLEIWESAVDTAASLRLTGDPDAGAHTEYANIIFHSRDSGTGANGGEAQIRAYRGSDRDAPYLNFDLANAGGTLQQVMTIHGQNNAVGIGTTNPDNTLHVRSGNTNSVARFESADAIARIIFQDNSGQTSIGATGDDMVFTTLSGLTERMRIKSDGNVGIGTPSPNSPLTVQSDASANSIQIYGRASDDGSDIDFFANDTTTRKARIFIDSNGFNISGRATGASDLLIDSSGNVGFNDGGQDADFRVEAAAATGSPKVADKEYALFVDASVGAVGIGTSQPSYALEVDGTAHVNGTFTADTKSFLIDHPTKEGYMLRYGCLEGPEHAVYVRGTGTTNKITLPDYWAGLIDEDTITVTLTPKGKFIPLFVEDTNDEEITVGGLEVGDVYDYIVHATRRDVDPLEVEFLRPVQGQ